MYLYICIQKEEQLNQISMQKFTNYDYLYPIFMFLFGLFMIFSPGSLIRKVKYDEERIKAESWLKKIGIGLCIFALLFAYFVYSGMNK